MGTPVFLEKASKKGIIVSALPPASKATLIGVLFLISGISSRVNADIAVLTAKTKLDKPIIL